MPPFPITSNIQVQSETTSDFRRVKQELLISYERTGKWMETEHCGCDLFHYAKLKQLSEMLNIYQSFKASNQNGERKTIQKYNLLIREVAGSGVTTRKEIE